MIAFVVSLNGQRVCTIGIGDSGVLSAHVNWVGRPGEAGDLFLGIGGLDTRTDQHIRWPDLPELEVGDTVTIQVIEADTVDPPTERKTPAQLIQDEKALLAELEASRQARLAAEEEPATGSDESHPPRRVPRRSDDELPPFAAPWE